MTSCGLRVAGKKGIAHRAYKKFGFRNDMQIAWGRAHSVKITNFWKLFTKPVGFAFFRISHSFSPNSASSPRHSPALSNDGRSHFPGPDRSSGDHTLHHINKINFNECSLNQIKSHQGGPNSNFCLLCSLIRSLTPGIKAPSRRICPKNCIHLANWRDARWRQIRHLWEQSVILNSFPCPNFITVCRSSSYFYTTGQKPVFVFRLSLPNQFKSHLYRLCHLCYLAKC